ncbi:hypothetical protein PAHAL_5G459500 [Panicum hallii]|uniref:Myb/SANT-like domain-containing protein n=1 Tax=Panicum hallii TaxID=206008 RepID=A0A2T8INL8_9POAL|nr:hypothetical protein PAHAL_5G459500 [Panicum hallii]
MDWTDDYNSIICELMREQVKNGNRPNTHLNTLGYTEVSDRFFQMTGIELKGDWTIWQKLMRMQTGVGWDAEKGVICMDNEWWKKAKKDIPGCGKFRKKALQNQECLREMFGDISSDETDHWNPMTDNPIVPESQQDLINVDSGDVEEEEEHQDMVHDWNYSPEEEELGVQESFVILEIPKKPKSSTALLIQDQITKIAESTSSFTSKKQGEVTISEIMDLVLDCGADYGSNEHDIATQLFVKKDQREMFLTLPTREIRFSWLTRRFNDNLFALEHVYVFLTLFVQFQLI